MDKYLKIWVGATVVVVVGILVIYFSAKYKVDKSIVPPDDPLMIAATQQAQETIDILLKWFPLYPHHSFVKYYAPTNEENDSMLIWGWVHKIDTQRGIIEAATDRKGEIRSPVVGLYYDQLQDWLIELPNGQVRGGFTSQVIYIREKQLANSAEERARIDSALGLFLDPFQQKQ